MKVRAKRRITYKDKAHNVGEVFEISSPKEAQALVQQGHVEEVKSEVSATVNPEDESAETLAEQDDVEGQDK